METLWTTPVMNPCTRNRYHPFWIPWILCRLVSEIAHLFDDVTVKTVFMRASCTTTEAGYCQIFQVTLKNTYYVYMTVLQDSSKVHIISHSMGNRVTSEAFLQYKPAGS